MWSIVACALGTSLVGRTGHAATRASGTQELVEAPRAEPPLETQPSEDDSSSVSEGRRALAIAASIVPGVVVHGTGHYVLGRSQTGTNLLLAQGAGLGGVLLGGAPIVLTGANRTLTGPMAVLVISGMGLFTTSWLADVWGVATPLSERGRPLLTPPVLETHLGFAYVNDPQFAFGSLLVTAFDYRVGRVRLSPEARFAPKDQNTRFRLEGAYRFVGPVPGPVRTPDNSFFDLELGWQSHTFHAEGFVQGTAEVSFGGRLDLARVESNLRGAFGELWTGISVVSTDFEAPGVDEEYNAQLLGRFAFGAYLGDPSDPTSNLRGGEVQVFYDHRHDDYAAGLKVTGLGSGVAGHFGMLSRYYFDEHWGVLAEAEVGSAHVFGLRLLFRQGVHR